jgi:hypothetical protein
MFVTVYAKVNDESKEVLVLRLMRDPDGGLSYELENKLNHSTIEESIG